MSYWVLTKTRNDLKEKKKDVSKKMKFHPPIGVQNQIWSLNQVPRFSPKFRPSSWFWVRRVAFADPNVGLA